VTVLWILLALFAVASVGGGAGLQGAGRGSASGAGVLFVGLVLGPALLGVVPADVARSFAPLGGAAAAWVAVVVGLDYGFAGNRRIAPRRIAGAALLALVPLATVALAVAAVLARAEGTGLLATREQVVIAVGAGAALAGTTRNALLWVIARRGARGPLTDLLHDLSDAGDLVPVLAVAALVGPDAAPALTGVAGWAGAAVAPLALGAVLGLGAALLVRFDARPDATFAALLGTSLVALGVATRFGVPPFAAAFALGLAAAAAAPAREVLRSLAWSLERPVLLPALVIAGALVDAEASPSLPAAVAAGVLAMVAGTALAAGALAAVSPLARRAGPALAPALATPGPFGVCVGLALAVRYPGPVGGTVLACAVAGAMAGELVSTRALRAALARAGELGVAAPEPEPPPTPIPEPHAERAP
jgi:hypothetical protein